MKPVNTRGAVKLMEDLFPKFRLARDSPGMSDLGSYWSYMTWQIIVRRRKAFLKELMVYWKQVLDKSLSLYCLPDPGVQQNRGHNIKHRVFYSKFTHQLVSQAQQIIFIHFLCNFLWESLVNERHSFVEEKLMATIKRFLSVQHMHNKA